MLPGKAIAQPRRRRWKAHTLVELLISSALFILMLSSLAVVLVSSNRYVRDAESKVEAQTQALAASIWISRNLSESNVTTSVVSNSPVGISYPSPRDPESGDVAWAGSNVGALIWRQVRYCYFIPDKGQIIYKGFPLQMSGLTPTVSMNGFPPFPTGVTDLAPALPAAFPANIDTLNTSLTKVVARNIRAFTVTLYNVDAVAPDPPRSATLMVESFSPAYSMNYGVQVRTTVRLQN